ncbi:beta-ketoacyl synthase N-terminal-like domain-containing protein [Pontibacter arcticus]|nr:beta-ketoacyl synthase N-terminal-like domain-containing protein [Pontibacter arcticus]
MGKEYIVLRGCGAISPLGFNEVTTAQSYTSGQPAFKTILHQNQPTPVAALSVDAENTLQQLIKANPAYKNLDRSVHLAIYAARQAAEEAGWLRSDHVLHDDLGVNIGSSRGAAGLFEQHFEAFQQNDLSAAASPTTTLGNLSSWVAHAVNAGGAQISHSITCSTALMALANGMAWLKAGMATRFLAGGTEAPLTDFTIAQMKAIGIYSKRDSHTFPCQPYAVAKQNTFVLGEGAAVFALELVAETELKKGDVILEAIGLGFEQIGSKTGISKEGLNFQKSMRHALSQLSEKDPGIELIITHTPGTYAGDSAELAALAAVFGAEAPAITTNKWLTGHTLGASGGLSVEFALHILRHQKFPAPSYPTSIQATAPASINRVLVNAAGFGGNAASIVLRQW